jgi:hypothetical protein
VIKRKDHERMSVQEASLTAWIVTFFILYIRFMVLPLHARAILLQVFIIVNLLVLPSDPEYFERKFTLSRIAILLLLAFGAELGG